MTNLAIKQPQYNWVDLIVISLVLSIFACTFNAAIVAALFYSDFFSYALMKFLIQLIL